MRALWSRCGYTVIFATCSISSEKMKPPIATEEAGVPEGLQTIGVGLTCLCPGGPDMSEHPSWARRGSWDLDGHQWTCQCICVCIENGMSYCMYWRQTYIHIHTVYMYTPKCICLCIRYISLINIIYITWQVRWVPYEIWRPYVYSVCIPNIHNLHDLK